MARGRPRKTTENLVAKKKLTSFETLLKIRRIDMDQNARDIFTRRYTLKNEGGKPRETIEQAFRRVADHVADGEENIELKEYYSKQFFYLMGTKRFVPNTPTWSGSGSLLGQLAACFVLPIVDDMGKENGGIFDTLKNAALIQQTGGGNGFSFSRLRPKGDRVFTSMGVASGPVSFLEAYDSAFGMIAQGGTRRGANMAVIRIDHPDVKDFIKCKSQEGKVANFNISVAVTDKFMKAVQEGWDFDFINPRNGEIWETVDARELFDKIVKYAYKNGEPGVLFIDEANRHNPVPNQYELEATNPCGEQWLGPYENCCLGHININASVVDSGINWEHLRESVVLGTRFLDDVVTKNAYVLSVPQLKESAHKNRRIGLGFMGLADAMYQLNIRYGSEESLNFASQVTEFIRYHSMLTSIDLARTRGPFPGIKDSIYDPKNLKWKIPTPLVEHKKDLGRPSLNWKRVEEGLKKHGIRNATQLTVAPTGTTATVYGLEGYGCEPVFALAYYRNVYQSAGGEENLQLTYVSPSFQRALDGSDLDQDSKKEIIEEAIHKGTIQHLKNVPGSIKHTFVVSADIKPKEHVWMQAVIQRFVDNSISKTCNFPETATEEDVAKAYKLAWDLKCKGLTVYVTGSREEVVLETKETQEKKNGNKGNPAQDTTQEATEVPEKRPRPKVVTGRTHEILTPFGKAFVTVNRNGETGRKPFEVFVVLGKSGSDTAALAEALGRLISGWLRSSANPDGAMEEIAYQLAGIGGSLSLGFGEERVSSIPDAVSKILQNELLLSKKLQESGMKELPEAEATEQESLFSNKVLKNASVCPECQNMSLIETEGCVKCQICAYSRC